MFTFCGQCVLTTIDGFIILKYNLNKVYSCKMFTFEGNPSFSSVYGQSIDLRLKGCCNDSLASLQQASPHGLHFSLRPPPGHGLKKLLPPPEASVKKS